MNICTKYGFDILIISGSYGGHRRHTMYDGHRTTPRVWHKLPTGELKRKKTSQNIVDKMLNAASCMWYNQNHNIAVQAFGQHVAKFCCLYLQPSDET